MQAASWLVTGSTKTDPDMLRFFAGLGMPVCENWGMSENCSVGTLNDPVTPRIGTVGKPIDNVEIRVTAADGKAVPAGKEGLIWVKSKTLSPKSIGPFDGEAPAAARASGMVAIGAIDKQGWLRTGDLGKLDKTGRLVITGREDDVVKVDGKRVALGEVEGCLEAFPKIKAAQATVVTDPMAGAMVVARVVMKQKCGAEEIIDHCARNLAPYKVPRRIEFCEAI